MDIIPIIAKVTAEERDAVIFGQWMMRCLLFLTIRGGVFGARHLWRTWRQNRSPHIHDAGGE
jgi:hypothetical protein